MVGFEDLVDLLQSIKLNDTQKEILKILQSSDLNRQLAEFLCKEISDNTGCYGVYGHTKHYSSEYGSKGNLMLPEVFDVNTKPALDEIGGETQTKNLIREVLIGIYLFESRDSYIEFLDLRKGKYVPVSRPQGELRRFMEREKIGPVDGLFKDEVIPSYCSTFNLPNLKEIMMMERHKI